MNKSVLPPGAVETASGASPSAPPLVERLATSSVALRQNWLFTGDGQAVKLGVQADEMEEAAICIADMLDALQRFTRAAKAIGDNLAEFDTITDGEFLDDLWRAERKAHEVIAKALGQDGTADRQGIPGRTPKPQEEQP